MIFLMFEEFSQGRIFFHLSFPKPCEINNLFDELSPPDKLAIYITMFNRVCGLI